MCRQKLREGYRIRATNAVNKAQTSLRIYKNLFDLALEDMFLYFWVLKWKISANRFLNRSSRKDRLIVFHSDHMENCVNLSPEHRT